MFHVNLGMFSLRFKLAALHLLTSTLAAGLDAYKDQQTAQTKSAFPQTETEGSLH